jgi:hypothetical protein
MRSRFNYHDFITYVIPGLLPCLIAITVVFARGHYRLFAYIQTFAGLIILLLFAYILGHLLQAIGAWFEKRIFYPHGYHPGEAFFWRKSGYLSPGEFDRLLSKYRERFGVELTQDELEDPLFRERCFNQIRWGIKDEARAEYIRALDGYYDLFRGLFVSFIICALISIPIALRIMPVPIRPGFYWKVFLVILVASIVAEYISARRTQDYLQAYTKEVINAFLGDK